MSSNRDLSFDNSRDMSIFKGDVPSLASYAAAELDDLILNRSRELSAVSLLIDEISESMVLSDGTEEADSQRTWLDPLDPTVAVLMHQAIMDSPLRSSEVQKIHQLLAQSRRIIDSLRRIVLDPEKAKENEDELNRMRAFCLALSKRAIAYEQSLCEFKPAHTYMG